MELTFYEDMNMNRDQLKRTLTLDFNGKGSHKRPKMANAILSSPDVNKVKMSSPELEKLILGNHTNGDMIPTPTSILFPKNVTQEQENYAQGFVEALNGLHNSDSSQGGFPSTEVSRASSTGTANFLNLDNAFSTGAAFHPFDLSPGDSNIIKDEPQIVPNMSCSSPPVSPIDMESQERFKLERKRLRNRVAASKCRRKKLEMIAHLETKVKNLKGENSELGLIVAKLREDIFRLKEQVITHIRSGCKISHPEAALQHL